MTSQLSPRQASDYRELVSRLIKSEMSKRKVKYEELSQKLAQIGTSQSAANLRNKINRGILGADLLLQIILVLNIKQLDSASLLEILDELD